MLEKALTARTTGELAVLTGDLPARPGAVVAQPKDLVEIKCMGGNAGRRGGRPARGPKQPVVLRVELTGQAWGGSVVVRPPRRNPWQWLLRRP